MAKRLFTADRDGKGVEERLRVVRNRLLHELEERTSNAAKRGELGTADLDRLFRLVLDAQRAAADPGRDRETVMEIVTSVPLEGFERDSDVAVATVPEKKRRGRPPKKKEE